MVGHNKYQSEAAMRLAVREGRHRESIGGLWEELGQLQLDFLKAQGLQPHHDFIDIGAGCLRAGVKLAPYLEPGRYYAIELSAALLEAGRGELELAGASQRVPRENLRTTASYDLSGYPAFAFGMAQSVFTHVPLDQFAACLDAIRPNFSGGGRLFATFFTASAGSQARQLHQPGGVVTFADRDPFHFTVDEILAVAADCRWCATWIGPWKHPRAQEICELSPG